MYAGLRGVLATVLGVSTRLDPSHQDRSQSSGQIVVIRPDRSHQDRSQSSGQIAVIRTDRSHQERSQSSGQVPVIRTDRIHQARSQSSDQIAVRLTFTRSSGEDHLTVASPGMQAVASPGTQAAGSSQPMEEEQPPPFLPKIIYDKQTKIPEPSADPPPL